MKTYASFFTVVMIHLFLFTACTKPSKDDSKLVQDKIGVAQVAKKQLRHVVLFKFKETTSIDSIKIVENAFAELPHKIKEIRDFEWGTNNSPEGINKGFTHSFFVTFGSEEDRATYLPHPDHKAFIKIVDPILEDVLVLDYWVKE